MEPLQEVFRALDGELGRSASLEEAARRAVDCIYEDCGRRFALVRAFVTLPYASLGPSMRSVVEATASQAAASQAAPLLPETPVLTLLGTRGAQQQWNDRRHSKGHVAIPLSSSAFIEAAPMIARLLSDLELSDVVIPAERRKGVSVTRSSSSGIFYVEDAASARDDLGRLVIPAQDFVRAQKVKTVFGVGGAYRSRAVFALVCFSTEHVTRDAALRFLPLTMIFRTATAALERDRRVFMHE